MMSRVLSKKFQLLLLLSFIVLFQIAHADLIGNICSRARNHALCERILRSDPRARAAGLRGLAQISINKSKRKAQSGVGLVTSLMSKARDHRSKGVYESCVENYNDAVDTLNDLPGFLRQGDYLGLNLHAAAAMTNADTCDEAFREGNQSPKEPPQLVAHSKRLQDVIDIILVIANSLRGA